MQAPPFDPEGMREPLLELSRLAAELEAAGNPEAGARLRAAVDGVKAAQAAWVERVQRTLAVHHEIGNALVGVSGNVQLLLLRAAARDAALRERLQVVLREADRIKDASARLRELRAALAGEPPRRAA